MEVRGSVDGVTVYDDFAHHPTAIETTIAGLRTRVGRERTRILAVLEPRSNTMKLGVMKAQLPASLADADLVFGYGAPAGRDALGWNLGEALAPLGDKAQAFDNLDALVKAVVAAAQPGDQVLVMSNGGFGGVHQKLLDAFGRPAGGPVHPRGARRDPLPARLSLLAEFVQGARDGGAPRCARPHRGMVLPHAAGVAARDHCAG